MNGAEILVKTALQAGIEVCFANPGTTEIPVVLALDTVPGIKGILGLFEGVCTGAADGYGRVLDRPAMTLLHLGPGFANGVANLHNAHRAGTPVVNIVGEHATWHRPANPPLAMDIEPLAATVSHWQRTATSVGALSLDVAEAISVAMRGQVSTLIVPQDILVCEVPGQTIEKPALAFDPVDLRAVEAARSLLRRHRKTALILGGRALRKPGLQAAARIRAATGCDLLTEGFPAYLERGLGLPVVERIPYFPEPALAMLSRYDGVVLASAREPMTFFGYAGIPGLLLTEQQEKLHIGTGSQNVTEVLECLADALGAPTAPGVAAGIPTKLERPALPEGDLTPEKVCLALAALQPENAIIVDEGLTTAFTYYPLTVALPPHSVLTVTGGAIGYGMPCAVGAKLASPERPVINLQADGSAMYTLQALWTQAREGLGVTTLICSNRSYHIIKVELSRAGITAPGVCAKALSEIDHPPINWVQVSQGFGVPAVSVTTAEALVHEMRKAFVEPGPHLIEMIL